MFLHLNSPRRHPNTGLLCRSATSIKYLEECTGRRELLSTCVWNAFKATIPSDNIEQTGENTFCCSHLSWIIVLNIEMRASFLRKTLGGEGGGCDICVSILSTVCLFGLEPFEASVPAPEVLQWEKGASIASACKKTWLGHGALCCCFTWESCCENCFLQMQITDIKQFSNWSWS